MRIKVALAALLLLTMATPAGAKEKGRPEPLDVRQATEIGRAAETNSLNGIYVSPYDGNVYVASVGGDEITVHDPDTGALLDRIGPERGVHGPDDLFITDDGTIYWTEILTGFVGMLPTSGDYKRQFVGPGVNPITMSDDGRLFVNRLFLGSGLYELDPALSDPPVVLDSSLNVNGFDFGPDGYLYAPSQFTGEIVRIDVDAPSPVGSTVVASGFRAPTGVNFNSLGEIHVGDLAEGLVVKLDLATDDREVLIDIEGTIDNIAFGTDDRFDPPGAGFASAATVAADGDNLIISSGFSNAVQVMDPETGAILQDIRTLAAPTNAIRHDGALVAAQLAAGNVVNADTLDVFIENTAETPLFVPLGLASDGETLYVGDWATGIVWAVSDAGTSLLTGGLSFPEGLAVDGDRLLVVETGRQQVTAIDLETGAHSVVIVGLDYSDRIPENFFPYGMFSGVAIGPDNSIYVSDDGVNKVYEFHQPR